MSFGPERTSQGQESSEYSQATESPAERKRQLKKKLAMLKSFLPVSRQIIDTQRAYFDGIAEINGPHFIGLPIEAIEEERTMAETLKKISAIEAELAALDVAQ